MVPKEEFKGITHSCLDGEKDDLTGDLGGGVADGDISASPPPPLANENLDLEGDGVAATGLGFGIGVAGVSGMGAVLASPDSDKVLAKDTGNT